MYFCEHRYHKVKMMKCPVQIDFENSQELFIPSPEGVTDPLDGQ